MVFPSIMQLTNTMVALATTINSAAKASAVPGLNQVAPLEANPSNGTQNTNVNTPVGVVCRIGNTQVSPTEIGYGIDYLHGKRGLMCGARAGPRVCTRVSCAWNAAIYLCNDKDVEIHVDCATIGDYAQSINDHCTWIEHSLSWVEGQAFDSDQWNVVVAGAWDGNC